MKKSDPITNPCLNKIIIQNHLAVYDLINEFNQSSKKQHKKEYKKLLKDIRQEHIKKASLTHLSFDNNTTTVLIISSIYGIKDYEINFNFNSNIVLKSEILETALKDASFKKYFEKVLFCLEVMRNTGVISQETLELNEILTYSDSILSIIFAYYLKNEKNITKEKLKSFFSKIIDWEKTKIDIDFPLSDEVKQDIREVKSAVKYEKFKEAICRNNKEYKKTYKYDVLQFFNNNIRIKYITPSEHKHLFHKSPIQHVRQGHWRYYKKSGLKVWVEEMIVGNKIELVEVA